MQEITSAEFSHVSSGPVGSPVCPSRNPAAMTDLHRRLMAARAGILELAMLRESHRRLVEEAKRALEDQSRRAEDQSRRTAKTGDNKRSKRSQRSVSESCEVAPRLSSSSSSDDDDEKEIDDEDVFYPNSSLINPRIISPITTTVSSSNSIFNNRLLATAAGRLVSSKTKQRRMSEFQCRGLGRDGKSSFCRTFNGIRLTAHRRRSEGPYLGPTRPPHSDICLTDSYRKPVVISGLTYDFPSPLHAVLSQFDLAGTRSLVGPAAPGRTPCPLEGGPAAPGRTPCPIEGGPAAPGRSSCSLDGGPTAPGRTPCPLEGEPAAPGRTPCPLEGGPAALGCSPCSLEGRPEGDCVSTVRLGKDAGIYGSGLARRRGRISRGSESTQPLPQLTGVRLSLDESSTSFPQRRKVHLGESDTVNSPVDPQVQPHLLYPHGVQELFSQTLEEDDLGEPLAAVSSASSNVDDRSSEDNPTRRDSELERSFSEEKDSEEQNRRLDPSGEEVVSRPRLSRTTLFRLSEEGYFSGSDTQPCAPPEAPPRRRGKGGSRSTSPNQNSLDVSSRTNSVANSTEDFTELKPEAGNGPCTVQSKTRIEALPSERLPIFC